MNDSNTFVTETDAKYVSRQSRKALLIAFGVLSLFPCLGFLVAWQTFAFFEGIVLISCAFAFFQKRGNSHSWKLEFNDGVITITNLTTKEEFYVYDIPASDLVINQSKNEIKLDYCSLMIKHTIFAFGGIKNCKQLKAYIQENFDRIIKVKGCKTMAIENDWKYDFSSLPRWDVRDRIPFVYDKFHPLTQCDALCCIYSIAEVRMCWNQGFLAILKNKEDPKLVLNINEELTFSDNFSASKKGDVIFLLSHFYDKTTCGVGNLLLIVDIAREKFSYLRINNHNPRYKVVELNDGVFGIEADEFQRSSDERLDAFSKTIIKLDCLDWYSFEDINTLSEIV